MSIEIDIEGLSGWLLRAVVADYGENGAYARIRTGSTQGRAQTVASGIEVNDRDPGDLAAELAGELRAAGSSEPAWIEIVPHGATSPARTYRVDPPPPEAKTDAAGSPEAALAQALGTAIGAIERMSRHATESKDLAEHRLAESQREREELINAAWLERMERQELELAAGGEKPDRVDQALLLLGPLIPAVARRMGLEVKPAAKQLPGPVAPKAPDAPEAPETSDAAEAPERTEAEAAAEARRHARQAALDAIALLREVGTDVPDLLGDEEIVGAMRPLVLAALTGGGGGAEPEAEEGE